MPNPTQPSAHLPEKEPAQVWYGWCGYWTDEWQNLKSFGPGIPCCPYCFAGGFQAKKEKWMDSARKFDADNPGYMAFLEKNKDVCFKGRGFMASFKASQSLSQPKDA